jgi:hypothetical protein
VDNIDSLKLELAASKYNHLKDNQFLIAERKRLARDVVALVDGGIEGAKHGSVAWRDALLAIRERASKETGP